jgi:sugar O-acyltransferase (sialic acid O-acetyltransferase NeuD family)
VIPLVVIGAGGHGRETLDIIEAINDREPTWDFLGFLDRGPVDEEVLARRNAKCIGDVDVLAELDGRYVIGIGSGAARRRIDQLARSWGREPAVLVHPTAVIGADVHLSAGVVIAAGAHVTTNVVIGRHSHVNVNSSVHHDCRVEDYVTVSPGVTVCGNVTLCDEAFVGAGATLNPGVRIGEGAVIGSGSVVVGDIPPGITAAGVPARATRAMRATAT